MKNKLITILLLIIIFIFSINIVRSWLYLSQKGKLISNEEAQLDQLKGIQEGLKKQLAQVQSKSYLEKEARNKLNLGREGEINIILPTILPDTTSAPAVDTSPNWHKWLKLFL